MKGGNRRKCPIRSVIQINKVAFDVYSLPVSEKVERREMSMVMRTKWRVYNHLDDMVRWESHCAKL